MRQSATRPRRHIRSNFVIYVMHVRVLAARTRRGLMLLLPLLALLPLRAQDLSSKIAALEQQVQKHLQAQKPQLAVPLLVEIVSLDPKNLNAQANLGVLLYFQGAYADAIPHMRVAMELKPDLWRIQGLLGIAEKRTGDPKRAQDDLENAFPHIDDQKFQKDAGLELIELDVASAQFTKALAVVTRLEE